MNKLLLVVFAVAFGAALQAQEAKPFSFGTKPPISDYALVNVPCFAPEGEAKLWPPLASVPKTVAKTPRAPDFQPAYNGVYVSLSSSADYLDYMQPESGPGLSSVNLRFDIGTWTTSRFEMPPGLDELIVPLFDSAQRQVGLLKLCSASISQNGSTLCTNLHIRAVVNHAVVIPPPGFDLQRVEDLNAAQGSGLACL